ncbi:MAG: TnsA endonuclease N-terminal domain-containing protein [Salinisphaera sp.]|nr:TnsA endonuclease N-terminal domain-containing protein [Salinisphaera sp.]
MQLSALADRHQHLLSDGELLALMCVWALPGVTDVLEQFPLDIEPGAHVLARYYQGFASGVYPGTKALAERLSIQHPRIRDGACLVDQWVMSTDILAIFDSPSWRCLAVSVKPSSKVTNRVAEKLRLEEAYWLERGQAWHLFIGETIPVKARYSIRSMAPYVLPHAQPPPEVRQRVVDAIGEISSKSIAQALAAVQAEFRMCLEDAQALFWQGVWLGDLPVCLQSHFGRGGAALRRARPDVSPAWAPLLRSLAS